MGDTINLRVNNRMRDACVKVQKEVATNIKKTYNLDKIEIHGTMASKIIAEKILGTNRFLNYKIHRIKGGMGKLELL